MAVHYVNGGGGLLGTLGNAMGLASMAIPGMQQFAPYIGAANSLIGGDIGGAVANAAAPSILKAFKGKTPNPNESLMEALSNAHNAGGRGVGGMPAWNTDPVTGEPNRFKREWGRH